MRFLSMTLACLTSSLITTGQDRGRAAPTLAFFDSRDAVITNPIHPYLFTAQELPFNFDRRPELFDPGIADQQVEAFDLGLRQLVSSGGEREVRSALDRLSRWAQQVS